MGPGDLLAGRFRIESEAGAGAMGLVYRAEDLVAGGRVAIKVRADGLQAARFVREARVLSRLDHPAIVRYVAHGSTLEGAPFLAMQWLDGEDLESRLARGPLVVEDSVVLVRRIADALRTMHARGMVHRDLKPSNLFLPDGDPGRVTLLDFGIARLGDATIAMTAAGAVIGTPGYMAPEQARGDLAIDARADVFALGCVLFECLTGRRVFIGEHVMAVLLKILLEDPPRMSELKSGIPEVLDELAARMLSKDPSLRPANGGAVCAELDAIEASVALARTLLPDTENRARPPSLSRGEQHLVSLVMAATPPVSAPGQTEVLSAPDLADVESGDGFARTVPSDSTPILAVSLGARFNARVEHLPDGLLIATLSGSGAATDQAAQAARCALAIRAAFPTAPIVLATGRALVTSRLPVGPVIDRAVQMLRAVQDGATFGPPPTQLDDTTAGLLPSRFRLRGTVLIEEERSADAPRTLLGKPTPFVGRDQELGTLLGLYRHVENDVVARAVVVTGAPGLGKSRLRDEFVRQLATQAEAPEIWLGAGDQLAARAPLATLARAMRGTFGLADAVAPEIGRRRVVARIARRVPADRVRRVAAFIAELLGVPFDATENVELFAARQEPALMAAQMERALVDLLDAECHAHPVVIVLEDAQWADAGTIKLVGSALRELDALPLLVVVLGRPEIDDAFPTLWADRAVTRIALPSLPRRAAERLALRVLGKSSADELVQRIVQQAGGNPFFLEELLRAALTDGGESQMPETVLAMVQKRLEGLGDELRRLLRAASVFGPMFWRGGASALLGAPSAPLLESWLLELVDRELLVRHTETRLTNEVEYGFRHGLVRDCAYLMLTDIDKSLAHKLAGDWLELAGAASPALLAEHFERGGETPRAIEKYGQAAGQALEANDLESAVRVVAHALALGASGEVRGRLHLSRSEAHRWRGDFEGAAADAMEATRELLADTVNWYKAMAGCIAANATIGRITEAAELADRLGKATSGDRPTYLMALAQSATYLLGVGQREAADSLLGLLRDAGEEVRATPLLTARNALAEAMLAHVNGDSQRTFEELLRAADHFEQAGDARSACAARANAGLVDSLMGRLERAERLLTEALTLAQRGGAFNTIAWTKQNLAFVVARVGRRAEGLELARDAARSARTQGDRRLEAKASITEAEILVELGDALAAEASARRALPLGEGASAIRAGALAVLVDALGAQGRDDEAHAAALEAASLLERGEALEEFAPAVRLALAESLFRQGRIEAARQAIGEARDAVLGRAEGIADRAERELFLACVPTHARTLARAIEWGPPSES